jgi:hypothetical protein
MEVASRKVVVTVDGVAGCDPATSKGFTVMRSMLKADPALLGPERASDDQASGHRAAASEWWESQWYKDEGGKNSCITLPVQLVGAPAQGEGHGAVVTGQAVPLLVYLLYEKSGERVLNQSILTHHKNSQQAIDPATGHAVLKMRINEVSRNHQHQNFQIQVVPDTATSPLSATVGGMLSPPVTVNSKRNGASRAHQHAGDAHVRRVGSGGSSCGGSFREQHFAGLNPFGALGTVAADLTSGASGGGGGERGRSGGASLDQDASHAGMRAAAAAAGLPPPPALPHPSGGANVQQNMENVLGWVGAVSSSSSSGRRLVVF